MNVGLQLFKLILVVNTINLEISSTAKRLTLGILDANIQVSKRTWCVINAFLFPVNKIVPLLCM